MKGKTSNLDIIKIKNVGYNLGYSYISINLSRLSDDESTQEFEDIKNQEIQTIEEEFLKSKGYSEKEIRIGRFLIESLGENKEKIKSQIEELFYHDNIWNIPWEYKKP